MKIYTEYGGNSSHMLKADKKTTITAIKRTISLFFKQRAAVFTHLALKMTSSTSSYIHHTIFLTISKIFLSPIERFEVF